MKTFRLATRRSPLALIQAELVQKKLLNLGIQSELVLVETSGDKDTTASLASLGGRGVFAVEIQLALLRGDADVAVHSAKDLPSISPEGLSLACVPERRDAADVLVGKSLAGLGPGATVATGSPRRAALLLERRPDLRIVELRGNMATRLAKPGSEGIDAVVAAAAALERLGKEQLSAERLDTQWFVPQVGQGALALEARENDDEALEALASLNDLSAFDCVRAERAFLAELGTGCSIPAGAYAQMSNGQISLSAVMIAIDGTKSVRATMTDSNPEELGKRIAIQLRDTENGASLPGWEK
ncbi:MAG: hydroxymethylbilane synthase [Acidimicrobiaceae bacterium]